jgi:hypothetical protein
LRRVGRWRKRARWVWCKLNAIPKKARIVVIAATILAVFSGMNLFISAPGEAGAVQPVKDRWG